MRTVFEWVEKKINKLKSRRDHTAVFTNAVPPQLALFLLLQLSVHWPITGSWWQAMNMMRSPVTQQPGQQSWTMITHVISGKEHEIDRDLVFLKWDESIKDLFLNVLKLLSQWLQKDFVSLPLKNSIAIHFCAKVFAFKAFKSLQHLKCVTDLHLILCNLALAIVLCILLSFYYSSPF